MAVNPYYRAFSAHPFIKSIASKQKWTISTSDKMPVDMYSLIYKGLVKGANKEEPYSLVDLDTLNLHVPDAANWAFCLDDEYDGFVVLDIEPHASEETKQKLLKLPYLYGEISMSGKGYHLIFPRPDKLLKEFPAATQKIVWQNKAEGWEVLLAHFVTFTGRIIDPPSNYSEDQSAFEDAMREIVSKQTVTSEANIDVEELEEVDTKCAPWILKLLILNGQNYKKTPDDFYDSRQGKNDMSVYEFAYMGFLKRKLDIILKTDAVKREDHVYTPSERAWFLYQAAQEVIPHRAKHDNHAVGGLPWLLFLAKKILSKSEAEKEEKEKKNKSENKKNKTEEDGGA